MKRAGLLLCLTGCVSLPPPAVFPGRFTEAKGRFVIYGDSRKRFAEEFWRQKPDRERQLVAEQLAIEAPDFILNTGDLMKWGSDREEWARFDRENANIRSGGIAYYAALGNHEYYGDQLGNFFARFPHLGNRKWYELRYRGVVLLVLDSNREYLTPEERAAQDRWLDERLAAAEGCVILAMHHAPMSNSVLFSGSSFARSFVRSPKIRAVFTGHVHSYEHFVENGVHYVVSGGGGAPPNKLGAGKYPDLYSGPRGFHYCRVRVGEHVEVDVMMLGEDGSWSCADTFRIN